MRCTSSSIRAVEIPVVVAVLRSVLKEHNPGDRHGRTSELTKQALDDLVDYLFSL